MGSQDDHRYVMIYFGYCNQYDIIKLPLNVVKNYRKGASMCVEYSKEEGGWATGRILQIGTKDQVENAISVNLTNEATRSKFLDKSAAQAE